MYRRRRVRCRDQIEIQKTLSMRAIRNAFVYAEGGGIRRRSVLFGERIFTVEEGASECSAEALALPSDAIVLPGFIDEHIHGGYGVDFRDDDAARAAQRLSSRLPSEGTTSFVATLAAQSRSKTCKTLRALRRYGESNVSAGARLLGVHLEGPFVQKSCCGGLAAEELLPPDSGTFREYERLGGGWVKIVTLAPELERAEELIGYLRGRGIIASLGHTAATYEQIERAVRAGATSVTHVFNAQSPFLHREAGAVGGALLLDELACEVIADTVHVSVPAVRLLVKCKPKEKVILITDSICLKGTGRDGTFVADGKRVIVTNGEPRLENGTLAGSMLCMNHAVRNMVEKVGVPIEEAVDFATVNPAKALRVDGETGSIRSGKYADFAIIDSRFRVLCTVRGGEVVYRAT